MLRLRAELPKACGLKDQKEIVRTSAAIALGQIGEDGDLVVPALLENLKDGSLIERTMTADALSSFGQRGKAAVPVILDLMEQQKTNEVYRGRLQGALGRIDPDAFKLKTEL